MNKAYHASIYMSSYLRDGTLGILPRIVYNATHGYVPLHAKRIIIRHVPPPEARRTPKAGVKMFSISRDGFFVLVCICYAQVAFNIVLIFCISKLLRGMK